MFSINTRPPCVMEAGWSQGSVMLQSSYLPPVCAFLSQRLKWVMCFWLRPKVLTVITLLSLTLIISCLRGAITEASTSNSPWIKEREGKKGQGIMLEALQLTLNVNRRKKWNIYFWLLWRKTSYACALKTFAKWNVPSRNVSSNWKWTGFFSFGPQKVGE